MDPFERLHPAVRYHIVNSLGWRDLRPLQRRAIGPLLDGRNLICLAPTAGGKTEAAVFPLLSQLLAEDRRGLNIIYVCPIKALLNNLLHRLSLYAGYFGRRVALWHGDIGAGEKRRILADPPDILLTTPESIELLLISVRTQPRRLFAPLAAVVVDELHAFAGFDRGWQLLLLIERLAQVAGRDLQRIGLSATLGNPAELLAWLAGSSQREREVVAVSAADAGLPPPEMQLDYVGSLRNAAMVISRLHRGEKRLVFCDSRRQVEELAYELLALGVNTFVTHSSLSMEARHQAEQAFAAGSNCVIVATSTLELGIDVGDLDRVIQIDAPFTVAAFLQRLGRTGRRAGKGRNCLFLAVTTAGLLRAGALIELWRQGYMEPVEPPPFPVQVVAQQILALCLQRGRMTEQDLRHHFAAIPPLAGTLGGGKGEVLDALLDHLLGQGYLVAEEGLLAIGPATEKTFGRRHYLALLSVFEAQSTYAVLFGQTEIGQIQSLSLTTNLEKFPFLTLSGRGWRVTQVDDPRRRVYVVPSEMRGESRWFGAGQTLSFAFCQAMRAFLSREAAPDYLSVRGKTLFGELQEEFAWLRPARTVLLGKRDGARWWNFAGYRANLLAAKGLERHLVVKRIADCWLELQSGEMLPELARRLGDLLGQKALPGQKMEVAGDEDGGEEIVAAVVDGLVDLEIDPEKGKFSDLLPGPLAARQALLRSVDPVGLDKVMAEGLALVQ